MSAYVYVRVRICVSVKICMCVFFACTSLGNNEFMTSRFASHTCNS